MANFIGVGLGGGVASTTFTPSGCAALGTVYAPAPITLTLTGDAGTLPCAALLEFSGDDTAFECYEIEGQELAAPVEVGSLPLNVRYLSWEQGTAITLKFYPLFVDGTAKSCDIVIKDQAGVVIDTKTLSATFADPVLGAVQDAGDALHFWSAQDVPTGVKGAHGTLAIDLINPANTDYEILTLDAADKEVVEGVLPGIGNGRSVGRYIKASKTGASSTFGIKSKSATVIQAGWFIVYQPDWTTSDGDVKCASGNYNAVDYPSYQRAFWRASRLGCRFSNYAVPSDNKSYFVAFRYDGAGTYWYFSDMEGAWKDHYTVYLTGGNVFSTGAHWLSDNTRTGKDIRILPGSVHSADIGEAGLEAIYDACKA